MYVLGCWSYFGRRDNAFRVQDMMLLYLYYFCFVTSATVCCALSGFASMHACENMWLCMLFDMEKSGSTIGNQIKRAWNHRSIIIIIASFIF